MAKAILEFDLNDFDDSTAHKRVMKAEDMAFVLFEFGYNTKKKFESQLDKYETKEDLLDDIYEAFWEEMKAHNVDIDEMLN